MELVDFLRARLDEDAELAASGETWSAFEESQQGTRRVDVDYSIERVVACTRSWRGLHIARHDPARVLAEVETKRALLRIHRRYVDEPEQACLGCAGGISWEACPVIPLLASPYRGHPDFDPSWIKD